MFSAATADQEPVESRRRPKSQSRPRRGQHTDCQNRSRDPPSSATERFPSALRATPCRSAPARTEIGDSPHGVTLLLSGGLFDSELACDLHGLRSGFRRPSPGGTYHFEKRGHSLSTTYEN